MKKLVAIILLTSSVLSAQNKALKFDGVSEYVSIPHKSKFNIGKNFTLEAWIFANNWKPNSWQGSILNKDKSGPDSGFAFRCGNGGQLSFVMSADGKWNEVVSPSIMNVKQWHHVAVVVENKDMKLFLDGQNVASAKYEGGAFGNSSELRIGASPGFGDRYFDGLIDELRVWQVARSQEEIANNKTSNFKGDEEGLVAYFPMDDGSGTIVQNLVDANCNASTVGMDNTNWSNGYQLPEYDLSVLEVTGIDRVNMKTRPVNLKTLVQNVGVKAVDKFELQIFLNGKILFVEEVDGGIEAGEAIEYDVVQSIDLIGLSDPLISVKAVLGGDSNSLNDFASRRIKTRDGNLVSLFYRDQHNFGSAGQNQFSTVTLPNDLFKYKKLLLHITVDCPSTGCDPWDQPAKLTAMTIDGAIEIARYITPFGKGCGPWTIDITDFKSVLGGTIDYNSYIQVWGQSGWLTTIDLELVEDASEISFNKLKSLWQLDYQVYGDPEVSYDLPEEIVRIDERTENAHVRMQVSGHGQGNTSNAAEFSEFTHTLNVNGLKWADHHLWKEDCNLNSCSNQFGTWRFARAGWCPGEAVNPMLFNFSNEFAGFSQLKLDYVLDQYNNTLNSGYNDGSHTEPHYRIHGFFVESSSENYDSTYFNLTANSLLPNIVGEGTGQDLESIDFSFSNTSFQTSNSSDFGQSIIRLYINGELASEEIDTATYSFGDYSVNILGDKGFIPGGENTFVAEIKFEKDINPGDNFIRTVTQGTSSIEEFSQASFIVKPNPSPKLVNFSLDEEFLGGEAILLTVDGKVLRKMKITQKQNAIQVHQQGLFLLQVTDFQGRKATKRVLVLSD